jgi:hypothetical protein
MSGRAIYCIILGILILTTIFSSAHTMEMEQESPHIMVTGTPAPQPTVKTNTFNSLLDESHSAHSHGNLTHTDDDLCKIYTLILGIGTDHAFLESAEIRYGHPPNAGYQNGNFTITIRAHNGTALMSYKVWDPRFQIEQYGFRNELKRHETMEDPGLEDGMGGDDIDLPLFIPYHKDIHTIELIDNSNGSLLVSVNVSPAVDAFRQKFPKDPDMIAEAQKDLPVIQVPAEGQGIVLMAGGVIALVLIVILIRLVRKA